MPAPRILVSPARSHLLAAVGEGGGTVVDEPGPDVDAVVWTDPRDPAGLRALLDEAPGIRWVQLPWAGIEPYREVLDHDRLWTCGKGVYADPVAEHALALALAGMRGVAASVRARRWGPPRGANLLHARVVVVGGGGIARSLVRLLAPFEASVTVVRRRDDPVPGATRTVTTGELDGVLPGADLVVLALALTEATDGLFDEHRLRRMGSGAWLVNVARGRHVVTDDLVAVLTDGGIAGAALDVTEPEPLPAEHPLWSLPNCIVTPHVGNTPAMAVPLLAARVRENVSRFRDGRALIGAVDVAAGY